MPNALLILSITCLVLSTLLVCVLLVLLVKSQSLNSKVVVNLLRDERIENQALRNQLRSPDLPTLSGLNYATLPSTKVTSQGSDPVEVEDLSEAINFEELLAKKGYHQGDLGHDLESAGWSSPIVRNGADEDPIAFDAS